jgi:hypothetical protein
VLAKLVAPLLLVLLVAPATLDDGSAADLAAQRLARDAGDAALARTWASLNETTGALGDTRAALADAEATRDRLGDTLARTMDEAAALNDSLAQMTASRDDARAQRDAFAAMDANLTQQLADARSRAASATALLAAQASAPGESVFAGNVTWRFTDERGVERAWTTSMDDDRAAVERDHPRALLTLATATGGSILVADPRPYVDPSTFDGKIGDLTAGRDARAFVREAFRVKSAFVTYGFSMTDLGGAYKYPVETMVDGAGVCGDTTILLASMLEAGSAQAGYGLKLKVWIVDVDVTTMLLVPNAETVDHAFLEVDYPDGGKEYVETTAPTFTTWAAPVGWAFDVP